MITKKEILVRKVSKSHNSSHARKTGIIYGKVTKIPPNFVGKYCLIIPLTSNEAQETGGKRRAKRLVDVLLDNPRIILDKIKVRKNAKREV